MKIPYPKLPEQMVQGLLPAGKGSGPNAPEMSTPFAEMLSSLTGGQPCLKAGPGAFDSKDLKTFAEMLSIRMGYRVLSSLGSLSPEQEDGPAAPLPFFSRLSSLSLQTTGKVPQGTGLPHPKPGPDTYRIGDERLEPIIERASASCGVDKGLIIEVIRAESGFDASALSSKGAMGLMQLMPETARELGVSNPYDPEENVMAGTRYLKSLLDRYDGSVPLALAAYNWGMGNLERSSGRLPKETREYVSRIMKGFGKERV